MRTDSVIELYPYLQRSHEVSVPSAGVRRDFWRTERRCRRIVAGVEAAVTVCIGAGFLVCLGLVISML